MSSLEKSTPITDRFVAIDVEPGGTTKSVGSIGLVQVVDGLVGEPFDLRFDALARPVRPSNPVFDPATGEPLEGFAAIYPTVVEFIGGSPMVAHNARYDKSRLNRLITTHTNEGGIAKIIDSQHIARRAWPDHAHGFALETLTRCLGIIPAEEIAVRRRAGRAVLRVTGKSFLIGAADDAWACAEVTRKAMETVGARTFPELLQKVNL